MNALTRASVLAADKLFATLDPVTRTLRLPSGGEAVLTDTVGFIQKLPHGLVAAFRATLEELKYADVLLLVADLSHPAATQQFETVMELLRDLNVDDKPRLLVLNKTDLVPPDGTDGARRLMDEATVIDPLGMMVPVSARTGQGLDELKTEVDLMLAGAARTPK
jgi:GTP-binding protein HflX